jgi:hypothetical protein
MRRKPPVILSPEIDRILSRIATVCSIIAWCAFLYSVIHDAQTVDFGRRQMIIVPVNLFSVTAVIGGLIGMLCSFTGVSYDFSDGWAWLFVLWCSLPFIGIAALLSQKPVW